ncbi:MAG: TonB-dependent receptor domain-containing protein [Lysobacterales bacterium]
MTNPKGRRGLHSIFLMICAGIGSDAMADTEEPVELPQITVVTAARAEQDIARTMASVSIISREDIRVSAAEDLLELLRLEAGVDVVRTGPAGAQTSVFVRGGNSDHLLVMIDGVRVASAHTGAYAWELLPLAMIERVEIVRGPRSTLYGSDAMSGVIQVFTRQLDGPVVRATAGSFGTGEVEAGVGFSHGDSRHSLFAAWRDVDGFSAQNPDGFSYDPDDDGLESRSAGANGMIGTRGGSLQYQLMGSRTETEFDQGTSEARQGLASLSWHGSLSEHWDYQLLAGYFDDRLETDYGFFNTRFESERWDLGWQNQYELAVGHLAFGLDFINESGVADGSYRADRDNRAGYASWEARFDHVDLQLGGRLDDNSEFGSEATWQAGAGAEWGAAGRFSVLLGTAFRAPDLGEQFSPGFGGFFAGNPDLQPESSSSLELNWKKNFGDRAAGSLAAFSTEFEDLIAFTGQNFQAINIARAKVSGIEAEWALSTAEWNIRANATLQNTKDKSTGQSLLRRPDEKGSLVIDRRFGGGSWLGLDWFLSGSRLDVGGTQLPGYGILSMRGGWVFNPSLTLEARWENVLDKAYEPAAGFNSAGRSVFISLDWRR